MSLTLLLILLACDAAGAQTTDGAVSPGENLAPLSLETMDDFESPSDNWMLAGSAWADLNERHAIDTEEGGGVLVNLHGGGDAEDLFTTWDHGDIELEMEFMMAAESNSGIYFQSRYELQLLDSWGVLQPRAGDMGGIYPWVEEGESGGGTPPRINATRAPGLWQHLRVIFRAPEFDEAGDKIANARFEEVVLNGEVIHRNIEVERPTAGRVDPEEVAEAPLRIQGTHGPIAFRNIRYGVPADEREGFGDRVPMRTEIGDRPLVVHGFMDMDGHDHTHTAAVGFSDQIHYALDQNNGSLLMVWKGEFLDLSTMWEGRGGRHLSLNRDAAISFGRSPAYARLESGDTVWPDSLQERLDYRFHHYEYEEKDLVWSYRLDGVEVRDRMWPENGNRELARTLEFTADETDDRLYFRVAASESLSWLPNGLLQVGDHAWYLSPGRELRRSSWIRESDGKRELVVPVADRQEQTFEYSIIW